jgi:hypothetical protein
MYSNQPLQGRGVFFVFQKTKFFKPHPKSISQLGFKTEPQKQKHLQGALDDMAICGYIGVITQIDLAPNKTY